MFQDRTDAGKALAAYLQREGVRPSVVLAVPRGGVPVAYEVARALGVPMELMLVKKLGHPDNKEYAIGGVSLTRSFVIPHKEVSNEYLLAEIDAVRARLLEMQEKFSLRHPPTELRGKTVLVVDDGCATGNTLLALTGVLRAAAPARLLIAVPVASREAARRLKAETDGFYALQVPESFGCVAAFYQEFPQVTDEEVQHYLDACNHGQPNVTP